MSEYKKEEPALHPHHGRTHSGRVKIPSTIENYLANIVWEVKLLRKDYCEPDSMLEETYELLIHYARQAWDLIPDKQVNVMREIEEEELQKMGEEENENP